MKAQGIRIETKYQQGPVMEGECYVFAELIINGEPGVITLNIQANGFGEIAPLIIMGGKVYEFRTTQIGFALRVPVTWLDGVPKTRQPGKDNLDIILIDAQLKFRDIQIGLVTRKKKFFITVQEVFEGWIREKDSETIFLSSKPEYAYPDMNYRNVWKDMGEVLAAFGRFTSALLEQFGETLQEPKPVEWAPNRPPEKEGWETGTVLFFNAITGTGQVARLEDGKKFFVHFSTILGEGNNPMLAPMTPVYFRPKEGEKPSVRSCKPA